MELKQKRFVYERAFTVEGAIQNLKSYQVARGEADPSVLCKRPSSGEKGREHLESSSSDRKRRKRRKYKERRKLKRQEKEKEEEEEKQKEISRRKGKKEEGKEPFSISETRDRDQREITSYQSSGSLGLLASHYSSSEDEEREKEEFLTVPNALLGMYESGSDSCSEEEGVVGEGGGGGGAKGRGERGEGEGQSSSGGLGFFEAPTDSSDDETDRPNKKEEKAQNKFQTKTPYKEESQKVGERWDPVKSKWKFPISNLQTFVCANCGNVGHFTKDCTITTATERGAVMIPVNLKTLYSKAHKLARTKDIHCADCGVTSNLVCCLDCRSVHCDGRGHLSSHLLSHPSHNCLFSCKLNKVIKCSNGQCGTVSAYDLFVCSHCLSNAFSHHYSMMTATWTSAGLRKIQNAITCEDHFHWHRVNCPSVAEEPLITRDKLHQSTISEFYF